MVSLEFKGSAYRFRKCANDLISTGGDMVDDDDSWDLMERDLQLKSVFLYCDFNQMISSAPQDQKMALTELANKLFCSIEELAKAVKIRSIPLTHDHCNKAAVILQEVLQALDVDC